MIQPKIINQTLDSLYLRLFSYSSPSSWLSYQALEWREYIQNFDYDSSEPYYVDLPNLGRFRLLHKGHTPYEFVLINREIGDIRLFNPEKFLGVSAIQTGQIYLDFRSKYLQTQSDDYGLIDDFIENCFTLFFQTKSELSWSKVSRADLAVDFLGVDFQWSDLTKLCTRSRKKEGLTSFCTIQDLQVVLDILSRSSPQVCNKGGSNDTSDKIHTIKLTQSQLNILCELTLQAVEDPTLSRAIFQKDLQTAYIGRFGSKIYARIYVKSAEIKVSGKDYLESFWKEKGYEQGDKVTRLEFSLSGDFLREFWATDDHSQYWSHFKENIQKIWTYCTTNWLRHTTGENSLNSRSPNSDFWDIAQTAFLTDHNFCRLPLPAVPSETLAAQILAQAKGCLKSFAALILGGYNKAFGSESLFGYPASQQIDLLEIMITEIGRDLHEDITYSEIQERRDRYGCDEFTDTAFSTALRKHRMKLGRGS